MIGPCQRPSLEDGPLVLVAIIGEPTGRWWNTGSAVLQAAWADAGLTASSLESPAVLGFAIVRAWHFITELDGPIELAMYEQCCIAEGGRRAVVGALSHQFLAPCALEEPMPLPVHHGGSPAALGERMRCLAKDRSVVVFGNDAVCAAYDSVDGVFARWTASCLIGPETLRCCLAWHLWAPLATLVVRRKWTLDMTALPVRVTRVDCWRAPVELPDHLVRLYTHWLRQVRAIPVSAPPPPPVTDKRTRYTAKDFMSFLALAQFLSSQRRLQPAVAAARAIVLDDDRAQAAPEAQIPHWRSTARARARLDVRAMIVPCSARWLPLSTTSTCSSMRARKAVAWKSSAAQRGSLNALPWIPLPAAPVSLTAACQFAGWGRGERHWKIRWRAWYISSGWSTAPTPPASVAPAAPCGVASRTWAWSSASPTTLMSWTPCSRTASLAYMRHPAAHSAPLGHVHPPRPVALLFCSHWR